jgi:hypothetical protein
MSPTASQSQWICIVFSLLVENDVRIIVSFLVPFFLIAIYVKDKSGDVQRSYTFAAQHFQRRKLSWKVLTYRHLERLWQSFAREQG